MNAREDRFTTTEHDAGLYEARHGESVDTPEPADREASFTPPTAERIVIVMEYEAGSDPGHALREAMAEINRGTARLNPNDVRVMSVHVGIREYVDRVLAVFEKEAAS